jgi:hypothetical protein
VSDTGSQEESCPPLGKAARLGSSGWPHLPHLRPTLDALCLAQCHSADTHFKVIMGFREKLNPGAELVVDDKLEG